MRSLRFGEMECENEDHEGNVIYGDNLLACPDCEEEAEDAYQDYLEGLREDQRLDRYDY
jgi:hypothetical protein